MGIFKKIVALLLAGVMTTMTLVGCGAKRVEEVEDDKTQLYLGLSAGGIGDAWLKDCMERFEEKYKDVSFEEGKKGVQVILADNNKTTMSGPTLLTSIETSKTEVFFVEAVFYYEWVQKNKLFDLTEMSREKLSDYGEDRSIADKMDQTTLESLTVDGKLYAIPYWTGSYGLVYNETLFDENDWFFAKNGAFTGLDGDLAAGPDGKEGTYDDGLPATYDDFFKLCDEIDRDNATPVQWAGASDYFPWFLGSLFADFSGEEELMLNYTFDGTATLVKEGSVNPETGVYTTEEVQITPENGYELARQEGLLKSLQFAQRLLRGMGVYYDAVTALSGSYKQQDAQLAFVRNTTSTANKPIAMMMDGSWWENEATAAFEETYGTGATKYDSECVYKQLPLPKADESKIGSENIWVSPLESYCFINPTIKEEKVDVATKFLQFCHSDESLKQFTKITGVLKPYDYELDESELTPYTQSMLEATRNSKVLYPKSNNDLYTYSPMSFWLASLFTTEIETGKYSVNIPTPLTQKSGKDFKLNYADCFNGLMKYRRDNLWRTFDTVLK